MQVRVRFVVVALHFWRKSSRLGAALLEEVSYETLVLETWRITFGGGHVRNAASLETWRFTFGSLVRNARFGDLALHSWRESRTKRRRATHPHTPTHRRSYITPAHPHSHSFTSALSFSLSTNLFSEYFKLRPEVMALGHGNWNYRLTRNCSKITCLACSRGSFTVSCGAIEEFEPGAASSDDVTVVVGAPLGVSAARQDISIKPYRIWSISVFHDIEQ